MWIICLFDGGLVFARACSQLILRKRFELVQGFTFVVEHFGALGGWEEIVIVRDFHKFICRFDCVGHMFY